MIPYIDQRVEAMAAEYTAQISMLAARCAAMAAERAADKAKHDEELAALKADLAEAQKSQEPRKPEAFDADAVLAERAAIQAAGFPKQPF